MGPTTIESLRRIISGAQVFALIREIRGYGIKMISHTGSPGTTMIPPASDTELSQTHVLAVRGFSSLNTWKELAFDDIEIDDIMIADPGLLAAAIFYPSVGYGSSYGDQVCHIANERFCTVGSCDT